MNGWIYGIEGGDCLGKENFRKEKMYNLNSTPTHSQTIQWAPNFRLCLPNHMGVDHSRIHMLMT